MCIVVSATRATAGARGIWTSVLWQQPQLFGVPTVACWRCSCSPFHFNHLHQPEHCEQLALFVKCSGNHIFLFVVCVVLAVCESLFVERVCVPRWLCLDFRITGSTQHNTRYVHIACMPPFPLRSWVFWLVQWSSSLCSCTNNLCARIVYLPLRLSEPFRLFAIVF